ncbi:MAG: RagB/SusD family nutrient uptake outer membrane protein [Bacteroidales bacterium]|nr:RagB/SusD family nutrient uptake outer membrane protein [Bacteroidales bacterium]
MFIGNFAHHVEMAGMLPEALVCWQVGGYAYPTKSIYDRFIEAGDSVRRKSSILTESELSVYGGKLRNSVSGNSLPWSCAGFIRLKYGAWKDETSASTTAVQEVNYGTNLRVIRYADVLLMASEAFNKSGNDQLAISYLNLVRKRVGLSDLSVSGSALFDAIVKERQLELAFEGHRFQDLKRWGLAKRYYQSREN